MKEYVNVELITDTSGAMHPRAVVLEDGRRFEISHVGDVRRAASLKAGGTGMRYRITTGNRDTYLYFEDPKWFVDTR